MAKAKKAAKAVANNWQTTLAGIGLAALNLYANGMTGKQIAVSIGLAGLGTLAGDGKAKAEK
jgi:hypothetical protein